MPRQSKPLRPILSIFRARKSKHATNQSTSQPPQTRPLLPELPPELWVHIFRFAVSTSSGSYNPLSYPPDTSDEPISFLTFPHSHSHFSQRLQHYYSSMREKLILTKVCKAWRKFAQQILYEFIWLSKNIQATTLATTLLRQDDIRLPSDIRTPNLGHFIKHLHIETPTMGRCCPSDLRVIIDRAPCLTVYSDYRSVRRNVFTSQSRDPWSPSQLFEAVAHPSNSLKRLSWTNYDDGSFLSTLPDQLIHAAPTLEFLELTYCTADLHNPQTPLPLRDPSTQLTLPNLTSLKVTLNNATLSVLAHWHMPKLRNLSIVSADFSYAGQGFADFFKLHGSKLHQLELGHSSSTIEEHYLTIPVDPPSTTFATRGIPLAQWCPNLAQFICSADAEWNWQNPDWIAPHVLLPTHPNLELIGIRDIDKRLLDDMSFTTTLTNDESPFFMLLSQMETLLSREAFPSLHYIRDLSPTSDTMRRQLPRPAALGGGGGGESHSWDILNFWSHVLERCGNSGVWFEDLKGTNVTQRDLARFEVEARWREEEAREEERERRRLGRRLGGRLGRLVSVIGRG
ncbi:hypothetical protein AMATHDRAFT_7957 [Amanita thiersii Skay4041]|uniref:F-box domain-containing protein n=1 Tax=Amanita thiersii Skay4041 TaxID=703135 RepID=A0A2A9NF49_9AGAR|nr:hypothetical protein AMATHDRAFT_7957 [Amanita thiersii Skay4041]